MTPRSDMLRRKWPYFLIAIVPPFVLAHVLGQGADIGGQGLYLGGPVDWIPDLFGALAPGAQPFAANPGDAGYLPSLSAGDTQFHRYDPTSRRTTISTESIAGERRIRIPVAEYRGRPSRTATVDRLYPLPSGYAVLNIHVVDDAGRSRRGTVVECGDGRGPSSKSDDLGEVALLVRPGTVRVGVAGAPQFQLRVSANELVWCTLGGGRFAVEHRAVSRRKCPRTP